tara:strand:+ start:7517 stop:9292 length:1776 start_codon:yes stop_codon:yes gene_type:complete
MTASPLVGNTFFGLDISQLGRQLISVRRRLSKRLLLLEFSASGLLFAEASPSVDGIRFSHVSRVSLPEEALERGVPSDPAMMASLVKELCQEKGIPAHRAAVVLSPDVAYQRILTLPSDLTLEEARLYICDPSNAVPLPFPLEQTDFDLYPLPRQQGSVSQPYLLIAVPQALIDRVITLLAHAGFELQALELGPLSVLRFLVDELISLRESDLHLVLELLPDCSQLCVVSSSGPIRFESLSAIRDFPCPDLDDDQRKEALGAGFSAEEMTLKDDRYLPISELDLRAVLRDMKAVISELMAQADSTVVRGLSLSGINSAHPLIKCLFQEALGFDVKVLNPILMSRVSGFSPDDLLVQAGLARLIGLGLGFLPREQLLSCHCPEISSSSVSSPLPSLTAESMTSVKVQRSTSQIAPLDVEVIQLSPDLVTSEDSEDSSTKGERVEVEEEVEEKGVVEQAEVREEEAWPSITAIPDLEVKEGIVDVEEEVEEKGVVEEAEVRGEEAWPSITSILDLDMKEGIVNVEEEVEETGVVEDAEGRGEEAWPSITSITDLEAKEGIVDAEKMQSTSQISPSVDDSFESSSLGELRFQDE